MEQPMETRQLTIQFFQRRVDINLGATHYPATDEREAMLVKFDELARDEMREAQHLRTRV